MNDPLNKRDFLATVNAAIEQLMNKRELSVINVADHLGIQPQRLHRLLKSSTGMSASQYIANERAEHAKLLLCEHDMLTIARVGYMCGFDEPTHFTRFFKRVTGMTPGEYRNGNEK